MASAYPSPPASFTTSPPPSPWVSHAARTAQAQYRDDLAELYREANTQRGFDVPRIRIRKHRRSATYSGVVVVMGRFRLTRKVKGARKASREEAKIDVMQRAVGWIHEMERMEKASAGRLKMMDGQSARAADCVKRGGEGGSGAGVAGGEASAGEEKKYVRWADEVDGGTRELAIRQARPCELSERGQ